MITPNSRYAQVEIATLSVTRNGLVTPIRYLRRRFIPPATGQVTFVHHTVRQGDRIDNITARYLTDPTLFWRICDFNGVLRPDELTDTLARVIEIALPLFTRPGK
jgi:hypothetical protein